MCAGNQTRLLWESSEGFSLLSSLSSSMVNVSQRSNFGKRHVPECFRTTRELLKRSERGGDGESVSERKLLLKTKKRQSLF